MLGLGLSVVSLAVLRLLGGGAPAFDPASIFVGNQPGMLLDPSVSATGFQESTGVTAGAINLPTGLRLDRRLGAPTTLGPEIITVAADREFSSNTGYWSLDGGVNISGGAMNWPAQANNFSFYRIGPLTSGKYYEATFTISSYTAGGVKLSAGATATRSAVGTYTERFTATSTVLGIQAVGASTTLSVDNFSIKEVEGNHVLQATSAARPTWSQRKNLFLRSEQFDNAAWSKSEGTVTANAATAPDGTTTADKFVPSTNATSHTLDQTTTLGFTSITKTLYAKADSYGYLGLSIYNTPYTGEVRASFDVAAGTLAALSTLGTAPTNTAYSVTSVGDGWYRTQVSATFASGTGINTSISVNPTNSNVFGAGSAGNGTSGILIWGAQCEVGLAATSYQRIATATDYATGSSFPYFDSFDGVDDGYATAAFSAGTLTADMDYFVAVKRNAAVFCILGGSNDVAPSSFFGAIDPANATVANDNVGAGTSCFVNGVAVPGGTVTTRIQLDAAIPVGSWVILEIRNLNLSSWDRFYLANYRQTSNYANANFGGVILCPAQSAGNRTNIRQYLAGKVGVTL